MGTTGSPADGLDCEVPVHRLDDVHTPAAEHASPAVTVLVLSSLLSALADALRQFSNGDVAQPVVSPRQCPLDALTDREREVLALMAEGRSNTAIGKTLYVSAKTVEAHVRQIFQKLGLEPSADHHRRVLAVLTLLRVASAQGGTPADD